MHNSFTSLPLKSTTIAILLTTFFGPFGLFYASVSGGFIMLFSIPIMVIFLLGASSFSSIAFGLTAFWCICFIVLYWPICIIWASISVEKYNRRIIEEERQYHYDNQELLLQQLGKSNIVNENALLLTKRQQLDSELEMLKNSLTNHEISEMEFLQKKEKLVRQIEILDHNLLASEHPIESKPENFEYPEKKKNYIWIIILALLLVGTLLYLGSKKGWLFDSYSKDRVEIKEQIEKTYFGLLNGGYTSETLKGVGPDGLPFYNQNMDNVLAMGLLPLANLMGVGLKLEPKNIDVYEFIDEITAKVKYDVIVQTGEVRDSVRIDMVAKKIGGYWKLDGEKAFGFSEDHKIEKNKKQEWKISTKALYINQVELDDSKSCEYKIKNLNEKGDNGEYQLIPYEGKKSFIFTKNYFYEIENGDILHKWRISKQIEDIEGTSFTTVEGVKIFLSEFFVITYPSGGTKSYDIDMVKASGAIIKSEFIK